MSHPESYNNTYKISEKIFEHLLDDTKVNILQSIYSPGEYEYCYKDGLLVLEFPNSPMEFEEDLENFLEAYEVPYNNYFHCLDYDTKGGNSIRFKPNQENIIETNVDYHDNIDNMELYDNDLKKAKFPSDDRLLFLAAQNDIKIATSIYQKDISIHYKDKKTGKTTIEIIQSSKGNTKLLCQIKSDLLKKHQPTNPHDYPSDDLSL